jgi:biopolymer transport protein ExbD
MVDVVFLLIVFFILVSQLTRTERTPIELPALPGETLKALNLRERLVIHVGADGYRIGAETFTPGPAAAAELATRIRAALAASPSAAVVVRAPRDARYAAVAPALRAARDAGAPDVRLIARELPQ